MRVLRLPVALSRRDLYNGIVSLTHLTLLVVVWYAPDARIAPLLLALIALVSLGLWRGALRRYHLIVDTPCSRASSAARGYVELQGRAELHADQVPIGFRSGPPCVWYRYRVEQRRGAGWVSHTQGCSEETFILNDGSGRCVIDPDGAEVHAAHHRSWQEGDYRIRIDYLAPGDVLYALGELTGLDTLRTVADKSTEKSLLIKDWKRDQTALRARFDTDGDGRIDTTEWERVRRAAAEEIEGVQSPAFADLLIVRRPSGGEPFILSDCDPRVLARRYTLWSWFHAGVFTAASVAALALLTR